VVEVEVEGSRRSWDAIRRPPGTRIHVITAHNPGSVARPPEENRAAHARLEQSLRARGFSYLPAVNRAPDGAWEEAGFAVLDAPRDEILGLGRDFGQLAVYEIQDGRRRVLPCGDGGAGVPTKGAGP
jgi:hypothetical protein